MDVAEEGGYRIAVLLPYTMVPFVIGVVARMEDGPEGRSCEVGI